MLRKDWIYAGLILAGMSMLGGCGGDSGGPTAKLTEETIDQLGQNAAKMLPGCEYNSNNVVSARMDDDLAMQYRDLLTRVDDEAKLQQKLGRAINKSEQGDCGGTMSETGTHENGIEDLVYNYDHYCTGDAMKQTVMNGTVKVHKDQTPAASGPELNYMTIDTQGSGLEVTNKADGKTTKNTTKLEGVKFTAAKNGQPATLEANTISAIDSNGNEFEIKNLKVETTKDNNDNFDTFTIKQATYKDPKVGSVTVKSTAIPYGDDAKGKSASITVTGEEGEAVFTTSDASSGKFSAKLDGKPVGAIDCSKNL